MRISLTILFFLFAVSAAFCQNAPGDSIRSVDQFKAELLSLRADVDNVQVNLGKSEKRFKAGILVSTIGYSVTIAGGLMLGRKQDDLGKGLLIAGGVTGITGTFLMVDAFKYLGRASKRRQP